MPTKWDPRLRPIADEVAKLRKLDFEHPVAAEFLDDAAFEKKVTTDRGKLSKQDKRDLERSQAQLRAVGLIGADVDLFDAVGSLQTSGVLAYYDPKTKKITVKGTNLDDVATRVTVAHELTHALQDQHFDLQKLEQAAAADHGSTVLHTIAEGDAVRIENEYVKTLSEADQQAYQTQNAQTERAGAVGDHRQGRPRFAERRVPGALRARPVDARRRDREGPGQGRRRALRGPADCRRRVRDALDPGRPPHVPDRAHAEARSRREARGQA